MQRWGAADAPELTRLLQAGPLPVPLRKLRVEELRGTAVTAAR